FGLLLPPPRRVQVDREGIVSGFARCSAKKDQLVQECPARPARASAPWVAARAPPGLRPRPAPEAAQDLARGVAPRQAGDAAARMRARAAHAQPRQRAAVVALSQQRTRAEQLVQAQRAVEDVAADQTEGALQVQWRQRLVAKHGGAEVRRVAVD